ncbi:MAG: DUF3368 domain-containing protein, partial [Methanothrix sp.]|nr:DUF3368 domain-containing protein [Methanothrix sp.]
MKKESVQDGLKISGVIGILIRAKLAGRISSLQDDLDRLRIDAGFWIGEEIYRKALRVSGED